MAGQGDVTGTPPPSARGSEWVSGIGGHQRGAELHITPGERQWCKGASPLRPKWLPTCNLCKSSTIFWILDSVDQKWERYNNIIT